MYYDRDFYILTWSMYGWKSLIFLGWMSSKHQFSIILRVLHSEKFQDRLWKIQNKNCAMGSVGSTIIALIAITSLLLPFANKTHWTARALWISSILSAFLSVAFSCKHQRFIGNIMLADQDDLWDMKRHLHEGPFDHAAKPRLGVVWLLSGTAMFFDISLVLYVVGLAVYLASIWKHNIDPDTNELGGRLIFILFLVVVTLFFGIYWVLDILSKTGRNLGWSCYRMWYEAQIYPNLGGCQRRACGESLEEDEERADLLTDFPDAKLPRLPLLWRKPIRKVTDHKSYCRLSNSCAWPGKAQTQNVDGKSRQHELILALEEMLTSAMVRSTTASIAAMKAPCTESMRGSQSSTESCRGLERQDCSAKMKIEHREII